MELQDLLFALRFETDGHGTLRALTQTGPDGDIEVYAEYTPSEVDDPAKLDPEIVGWCAEIARTYFDEYAQRQGWVE